MLNKIFREFPLKYSEENFYSIFKLWDFSCIRLCIPFLRRRYVKIVKNDSVIIQKLYSHFYITSK